jgi:hydroxyethylthiazole kinase-like uncharacterized protein yjeF
MVPILSPSQSRDWDARAEATGRPLRMLMENAGRAVARSLVEDFDDIALRGVLIATGPGNNGGDGWVAARTLHLIDVPVWVTEVSEPPPGIAADARRAALDDGVATLPVDGPWPPLGVIVDAMLGTGARGEPRGPIATMIARLASFGLPVLAIDGPTGLDLETGIDNGALPAVSTVTFGGFRRGHLLARDVVGKVMVEEVGHPLPDPAWPVCVDQRWARSQRSPFAAAAHKGDRGRIVVVGGAPGMTGAARLAARSAFAAGAGVVHVVVPDEAMSDIALAEPDVLVFGHPFAAPLAAGLHELLARADAVVIGPGLGREAGRAEFVLAALRVAQRAVIDADALTVLAGHRDELAAHASRIPVVLTPHRGEFRTLFADLADGAATDPWMAARDAARSTSATVLLKGVPTVVAHGEDPVLTIASGNPGLATGGSGDVLSGLIGVLLAQGLGPSIAAAVAAEALGQAALFAAQEHGPRTMRPMHVVGAMAEVWKQWSHNDAPRDGEEFPEMYLAELLPPLTG